MKAIVLLSNGFEETEAVAPIDILKRAGVEVDICSITGSDVLTGAHNIVFSADMVLENLLKKREENYQKAHYIIDISELTEDDIVTKILGCIDETSSWCRWFRL